MVSDRSRRKADAASRNEVSPASSAENSRVLRHSRRSQIKTEDLPVKKEQTDNKTKSSKGHVSVAATNGIDDSMHQTRRTSHQETVSKLEVFCLDIG